MLVLLAAKKIIETASYILFFFCYIPEKRILFLLFSCWLLATTCFCLLLSASFLNPKILVFVLLPHLLFYHLTKSHMSSTMKISLSFIYHSLLLNFFIRSVHFVFFFVLHVLSALNSCLYIARNWIHTNWMACRLSLGEMLYIFLFLLIHFQYFVFV